MLIKGVNNCFKVIKKACLRFPDPLGKTNMKKALKPYNPTLTTMSFMFILFINNDIDIRILGVEGVLPSEHINGIIITIVMSAAYACFVIIKKLELYSKTERIRSLILKFAMKHLNRLLIASGTLMVVCIVIIVVISISLERDPIISQGPIQLINGEVVYITENRTFDIFIQDRSMPLLVRYDFSFINTDNQNIITSYTPTRFQLYEREVHGIFRRLVAEVDLVPGSYEIHFEPWEGSGIFTFGSESFRRIMLFTKHLSLTVFSFIIFMYTFIFLFNKRRELKRFEDELSNGIIYIQRTTTSKVKCFCQAFRFSIQSERFRLWLVSVI